MSKIHRGMSITHNFKKDIREKNKNGRKMLEKAKELFYERTNKEPKKNRARITAIKKLLLRKETETVKNKLDEIAQSLEKIFSRFA